MGPRESYPWEMTHVAELVRGAAQGDRVAWGDLVDRFAGLIWAIAKSQGLDDSDAKEVSQTTWLRLAEHIDRLTDPHKLAAWLTTTAKRESIRLGRLGARQVLVDPWSMLGRVEEDAVSLDSTLLREEEDILVQQAMALMPSRCRELLTRLVASDEPPSYSSLSAESGIPVGSIGPTRNRCLEQLRRLLSEVGVRAEAAPIGRRTQ